MGKRQCARLSVALYGTRAVAQAWEEDYVELLAKDRGFTRAESCQRTPCRKKRSLRTIVHGDDFVTTGPEKEAEKLRHVMDRKFEAKHKVIGRRTSTLNP